MFRKMEPSSSQIRNGILHKVAATGTPEMIRDLIKCGAHINARDHNGNTPLMCAAESDKSDNILCLLTLGASARYRNFRGWSVLHCLAENGTNEMLIQIIINKISGVNEKTYIYKKIPLHIACSRKIIHSSSDYRIVKILVKNGAVLDAKDHRGMPPFHEACCKGNLEIASYLLKSGANCYSKCKSGLSALHFAVIGGEERIDVIELILRKGCNVNASNDARKTPLFYVDFHNLSQSWEIIKLLLAYGADVNARDFMNDNILHVLFKQFFTFNLNLEHLVKLNAVNEWGFTPVEYAFNEFDEVHLRTNEILFANLISYIAKRKAENFNVSERNLEIAQSFKLFREYEYEIERMKKRKVVETSYVSFFHIFIKDIYRLLVLCRNEEIIEVLDYKNYLKEFPLYGEFLEKHIEEGKSRLFLIQKAEIIFKDIEYVLPDVIIALTLNHLNDFHLKNFIEAFIHL